MTVGLCGTIGACDNSGLADWAGAGGNAGRPPISSRGGAGGDGGAGGSTAGTGGGAQGGAAGDGTAGTGGTGGAAGNAGSAAGGGTGGTDIVYDCPADDGTAAALTLAGLGLELPPNVADAGVGDAGAADEFEGLQLPGLIGWASHAGLGTATTIGGAAGEVVTATTAAELIDFASRTEPLVIRICGVIAAPELVVTSHKTLLGVGTGNVGGIDGGIRIGADGQNVRNVVLKNLHVNAGTSAVAGTGIRIDNAHHVWIDHCDLSNSFDTGAGIEVVRGADLVTVSWTKFHFTESTPDPEHRFGCRIGDHDNPDESAVMDPGHLNVTLHHNWFADNVRQRAPRVRFGDVHVFNNYYSVGTLLNDYSIWASTGSHVLIENNYFKGVVNPHEIQSAEGQILAIGNLYDGATGLIQSTGTAFTPPYAYTLDPALGIPALVTESVGPR